MKRQYLKKKMAIAIVMGLSVVGLIGVMNHAPQKAYAFGGGGGVTETIKDTTSNPNSPDWIAFNPNYRDPSTGGETPQAQYYSKASGRWSAFPNKDFVQIGSTYELKLWREAYMPNNPSTWGFAKLSPFVWYTPNPPANMDAAQSTQNPGLIYENTTNIEGYVGSGMAVSSQAPYAYDLSNTAQNPWSFTKTNQAPTPLPAGTYAGSNYVWRFAGYSVDGSRIDNPFYPVDIQSLYNYVSMNGANNQSASDAQLSTLHWLAPSDLSGKQWWNVPSLDASWGQSPYVNLPTSVKDTYFTYLFSQYPLLQSAHSKSWWESVLMPSGDPSTEAVVWTGYVNWQGTNLYLSIATAPPAQPNLRLTELDVYDTNNTLVGQFQRNAQGDGYTVTRTNGMGLIPGQHYTVVAKVLNVNPPSNTIPNSVKIQQEMNAMVGNPTSLTGTVNWTQFRNKGFTYVGASNLYGLSSGATATFTWHYIVPTNPSSQFVTIASQIPASYSNANGVDDNTNPGDDQAAITLPVLKNDLSLVELEVYNSSGTLLGKEYRTTGDTGYFTPNPSSLPSLSPGQTYKVVAMVKNMTKENIQNTTMQQEIGAMPDNTTVGGSTNWSSFSLNAQWIGAASPYQNGLPAGQTASYTWNFTVPSKTTAKTVTIASQIPSTYATKGYDSDPNNNRSSLTFPIGNENLAVSFMGYLNSNFQPLTHISTNYNYSWENDYVEYKVTLTKGTKPINDPLLNIWVASGQGNFTVPYDTYQYVNNNYESTIYDGNQSPIAMYHANGSRIRNDELSQPGDYAVYRVSIQPTVPEICTQAEIPITYNQQGLDSSLSDDKATPACFVQMDNISVSNMRISPNPIYINQAPVGYYNYWGNNAWTYQSPNVYVTVSNNDPGGGYRNIPVYVWVNGYYVNDAFVNLGPEASAVVGIPIPQWYQEGNYDVVVEANPPYDSQYWYDGYNYNGQREYTEFIPNVSNPYYDNTLHKTLQVLPQPIDVNCPVSNPTNTWPIYWQLSWTTGTEVQNGTPPGGTSCDETGSGSHSGTFIATESYRVTQVMFDSKYTNDHYGGWVDLLTHKDEGIIKAGYGYQLKITTTYSTNTNQMPYSYGGCSYNQSVTPSIDPVDAPPAYIKVTMPDGRSLTLSSVDTNSWYNRTATYTLPSATTIAVPEQKYYVGTNTKDGYYPINIQTSQFYGSYNKIDNGGLPAPIYQNICDNVTVDVHVRGSYLDDLHNSVIQ